MSTDDVIDQAARVLYDHNHLTPTDWADACVLAERLAAEGLLARPLPDREHVADAILEAELRHRPPGIGGQVVPSIGDRHLAAADAVLALLKGQDR